MTKASELTPQQQLADLQAKLQASLMAPRGLGRRIEAIRAAIQALETQMAEPEEETPNDSTTGPDGTEQR